MTTPTVGSVLYAFFQDHLKAQKGLSNASVKSYRDALRLFLDFVARDTQRKLTKLTLEAYHRPSGTRKAGSCGSSLPRTAAPCSIAYKTMSWNPKPRG